MTLPVIGVTGATGFVGEAVCEALRGRARVVALSRTAPATAGVEWRPLPDLGTDAPLAGTLVGLDALVHLAALAHSGGREDPVFEERIKRVNVVATLALARAAAACGTRRFVFLSSIKAIAESSQAPLSVDAPPAPEDAYGRAKLAAEQGLARIGRDDGIDVAVFRCPLVYGHGEKGNLRALGRVVRAGIPLPFRSVRNRRSLIALPVLADALAFAACNPSPVSGVYHIADAKAYSTGDIVDLLARTAGVHARQFAFPPALLRVVARLLGGRGLADRLLGSLELETAPSYRKLGWSPPPQ